MTNGKVTGVRSIELGVRDLRQSADFYIKVWALDEVAVDGDGIHLRTTVDQLCAKAKSYGVKVLGDPAPLSGAAGGGYGFRFETPDGLPMSISSDGTQHPDVVLDRSRPTKISHVVLNSADADEQMPFFIDVLGFRRSDSTHMMEFLRCCSDHHSIAIV